MSHIIAYTGDAAILCPCCAIQKYNGGYPGAFHGMESDEHGMSFAATDREGNWVRPVFTTDSLEPGESCATCGGVL